MSSKETGFSDPSALSLLDAAKEFLEGALMLRGHQTQGLTAAFLFGFSLELALKSYIVHAAVKTVDEIKIHDLTMLWSWAAIPGSPFGSPPPDWLANVS